MPTKPRLLILGLDGASYELIEQGMAAGWLPSFAAFAREAARARLRCTWPPHTATGWSSLFTGRLPGAHGIFDFWDCQDPEYHLRVVARQQVGCPTLWDVFAEQGWTVGLVNIPMSHPPGPWAGYQITWPLEPTLRYCKPPGLLHELSCLGGHVAPDIACMYDGSADYPERATNYVRARTKTMRHLITTRPTDVVAVVFTEIDRVCHYYWHGLDEHHPKHPQARPEQRQVIADLYIEIDAAFAEILDVISDECVIVLASDHGFGPSTRGLRLHRVLAEGGFCKLRPTGNASTPTHELAQSSYAGHIVWERTQAYLPTPGFGVNLNMQGRQASGIVSITDRQDVLRAVSDYLLALPDPETGDAVFEAVVPGEVAYVGPYAANAPDLLLVPADPALKLLTDTEGPVWDASDWTGMHRLEGVWMMRAPDTPPGARGQAVAIEAVAGRLLDALGCTNDTIPSVDWTRPAQEALGKAGLPEDAWSLTRDPLPSGSVYLKTEGGAKQTAAADALPPSAPQDDAEVVKRLKEMGYI